MSNSTNSVQTESQANTPTNNQYPDLMSLNRNDLIKSLYEIVRILDVLKQKIAVAQATEDEMKELEKKGKAEAEVLPDSWEKKLLIGAVILCVIILVCDGTFNGSAFLGSFLISLTLYILIRILAGHIYPIVHSKEVDAKYQVFANEQYCTKTISTGPATARYQCLSQHRRVSMGRQLTS